MRLNAADTNSGDKSVESDRTACIDGEAHLICNKHKNLERQNDRNEQQKKQQSTTSPSTQCLVLYLWFTFVQDYNSYNHNFISLNEITSQKKRNQLRCRLCNETKTVALIILQILQRWIYTSSFTMNNSNKLQNKKKESDKQQEILKNWNYVSLIRTIFAIHMDVNFLEAHKT